MAMIFNLDGDAERLVGFELIKLSRTKDSTKQITFDLHLTSANEHYFQKIAHYWRVIVAGEEYVITLLDRRTQGDSFVVKIGATWRPLIDLRKLNVNESFTGSRTFNDILTFILKDTGYSFNIIGFFEAQSFENFGKDRVLNCLLKAAQRYGAEFEINNKMITMRDKIGRNLDFQYRHPFNLQSTDQEIDAIDFATHGEGFGKDDLYSSYTHPLAAIYGHEYGRIEAESVHDERFTIQESLDRRVKKVVDESLKIAITIKFVDMVKNGYAEAQPDPGDTALLYDKRLGISTEARIVEVVQWLDESEEIIDSDISFSNFSGGKTQQQRMSDGLRAVMDAIEGRRPLPFEALNYMVQTIANDINNSKSEIEYPESGGIILRDPSDPNLLIRLESRGIGLSQDGGQEYRYGFTGKGMVADLLVAGTIFTSEVRIEGPSGNFYIDGDRMTARSNDNPDNDYTIIEPGLTEIKGRGLHLIRPDGYPNVQNGILVGDFNVQGQMSPPIDPSLGSDDIRRTQFGYVSNTSDKFSVEYAGFKHENRYLTVFVQQRVEFSAMESTVTVETTGSVPDILAEYKTNNTSSEFSDLQNMITVDLGVPDGSNKNIWVRAKCSNDNEMFIALLRIWKHG